MMRVLAHKFYWKADDIGEAVDQIISFTKNVKPTERVDVVKTDPDDNRILECAVAAGSDVIVSGDTDLLTLGSYGGIKILRVPDFLSQSRGR